MYCVHVRIRGIVPILQHRFTPAQLGTLMQGATKKTGAVDYSLEWMESMHITQDGWLCQPATHLEGAMVDAARRFGIKGGRGRTWKEAIRAYCYVQPEELIHLRAGQPVRAPGPELLNSPTDYLRVDTRRVRVKQAAVARSRLLIAEGWELDFRVEVHDEQVQADVLSEILNEAGRAVGIGDFRPRYGRFSVVTFEMVAQDPS